MKTRPLSVTIIGWFLIVTALISIYSFTTPFGPPGARAAMGPGPGPFGAHMALAWAGVAVSLACGWGILKGRNWARLLYLAWNLAATAIGLATSPSKSLILLGLAMTAVIAFFLFRKPADDFFGKSYLGRGAAAGESPSTE